MKKHIGQLRLDKWHNYKILEVPGYLVPSPPGFEFMALFVHRPIHYFNKDTGQATFDETTWKVSDLHIGLAVFPPSDGYEGTRQDAIDAVYHFLTKVQGLSKVRSIWKAQFAKYDNKSLFRETRR